ncbi:hypothetical protein [Wolbachia pipientis]|uniref:hypothetical protein n=1 Tax=Wolbachia pipientis TaxID=955 RepID=UPI0025A43020|nr:hypothetical protein [Wolbachia pipientis]MDM8335427.1 hypothetical protein [Wolbachia pipientis]
MEIQTPSKPKSQAFSFPASKDSTKEKSNNKKPEKAKVPLKQAISPSVNKSSIEEKSSDKKPQSDKKEDAVQLQENKKEEGLLSLLKRFVKKML